MARQRHSSGRPGFNKPSRLEKKGANIMICDHENTNRRTMKSMTKSRWFSSWFDAGSGPRHSGRITGCGRPDSALDYYVTRTLNTCSLTADFLS